MDKAGYMSLELVDKLTDEILEKYKKFFRKINVPYDNEDQNSDNQVLQFGYGEKSLNTASILIDGAHHARELTTVQFIYYIILKILYEFEIEEIVF